MKKILSVLVFSLAFVGLSPAHAAGESQRIGIYMIDGRTSTIYRTSIADSQNQIQWVTCLEAVDQPMLFPFKDKISYSFTVTGPDGFQDSGSWGVWGSADSDSMSSCSSNNGSGNQYTVAYNLTGLKAGSAYTISILGSSVQGAFSASKTFTTLPPTVQASQPVVESATASVTPSTLTETSTTPTPTPTPAPAPAPTVTPAPTVAPVPQTSGFGGYAVVHPDGHVCGVTVSNSADPFNNGGVIGQEYMGCPATALFIFQTKPSPTGNVAGWHGENVKYRNGIFTITNNGQVSITIENGIATDSSGRVWDTGSGETLRAAPSVPTLPIVESSTSLSNSSSIPASTPSPTETSTSPVTPSTPSTPITPSASSGDEDLALVDEVEAEEESIDSIDAAIQSNGTTVITVATGYNLTSMTVVATKKGSKKKYTYKIKTNADGERKFKSGVNLRGFTVVLLKGSTELDRVIVR
jgi:hypothetical protein